MAQDAHTFRAPKGPLRVSALKYQSAIIPETGQCSKEGTQTMSNFMLVTRSLLENELSET